MNFEKFTVVHVNIRDKTNLPNDIIMSSINMCMHQLLILYNSKV
jgi:hypothetical protein